MRDEVAQRHGVLAQVTQRDTWIDEMARRYGIGGAHGRYGRYGDAYGELGDDVDELE